MTTDFEEVDDDDRDFSTPDLTGDAAAMLAAGEQLVIQTTHTCKTPAEMRGIVTTTRIAITGTNPVRYVNPAEQFDRIYTQFHENLNEATELWDSVGSDNREILLTNTQGKFCLRMGNAYKHAEEMLAILSTPTSCNQKNSERYRTAITTFLELARNVLNIKEPEPARQRS